MAGPKYGARASIGSPIAVFALEGSQDGAAGGNFEFSTATPQKHIPITDSEAKERVYPRRSPHCPHDFFHRFTRAVGHDYFDDKRSFR